MIGRRSLCGAVRDLDTGLGRYGLRATIAVSGNDRSSYFMQVSYRRSGVVIVSQDLMEATDFALTSARLDEAASSDEPSSVTRLK